MGKNLEQACLHLVHSEVPCHLIRARSHPQLFVSGNIVGAQVYIKANCVCIREREREGGRGAFKYLMKSTCLHGGLAVFENFLLHCIRLQWVGGKGWGELPYWFSDR